MRQREGCFLPKGCQLKRILMPNRRCSEPEPSISPLDTARPPGVGSTHHWQGVDAPGVKVGPLNGNSVASLLSHL